MRLKFRLPWYIQRAIGGINTPKADLFANFPYRTDSAAGINIDAQTAITLSAVYNAVNIWANSLNIPINVFEKLPNGDRKHLVNSNVQKILNRPSSELSATFWISMMEMSRAFYGNGYSYINFQRNMDVKELIWIHPDFVTVKVDNKGNLFYDIRVYDTRSVGIKDNKQNKSGFLIFENVPSRKMIHTRTLSLDGHLGRAPIEVAAESMGVAIQQQKFAATFFKHGSKSDGVLEYPGTLDKKAKESLRTTIQAQRTKGGVLLLEYGLMYKPISIPPEQAQFLASRQFSVQEIARWYDVPPHMLKDLERATFSNIEHQSIEFVTNNVRPRARLYEQEFNYKLLFDDPKIFTKYNLNALLRADIKARADFYVKMVQNGIMNRDEIRELENLNKIPDGEGEKFLTPMNLTTDEDRENIKENEGT